MSIAAMRQALEALENHTAIKHPQQRHYRDAAIDALRQAIEQAEQTQPVATVQCINGVTIGYLETVQPIGTKLYTVPPRQPWVGLTTEEVYACDEQSGLPQREITTGDLQAFAQAIEAKLKEKNT